MTVLVAAIVVVVVVGAVVVGYLARRLDRVRKRLDAAKAEWQRKIREDGLPAEVDYVEAQIERELDTLRGNAAADSWKAHRLEELRALIRRVDRLRPAPFDAAACCVEEVAIWREMYPGHEITLDGTDDRGRAELLGDDALFRWVLREMFSNVLAHAGQWSAVKLKLDAADGALAVAFEDDGDGPELMMVSRFYGAFTPRIESPGPGLGLFVARAIVERMGGTIHASPGARGGLVHTLRLPTAAAAAPSERAASAHG